MGFSPSMCEGISAGLRGFAGKGFPGTAEEGLPGGALQCPGWPLCGVVILAVCFLASEGWGALSQGSSLSLSSPPTKGLGGNLDSFMQNGLWSPGVCILLMRWCCIHTISCNPHR